MPGHRQARLRLHHRGQSPVHRLAFDMPARQAGKVPVFVGIGGFSHFSEAEIDAFGEQHIEQADAILARRAGSQVGEGVGEAGCPIYLQQQFGDPDFRQAMIKVEDQLVGVD